MHCVERSQIAHLAPLVKLGAVQEVRVPGAICMCELRDGLDLEGIVRAQARLMGLVEEGCGSARLGGCCTQCRRSTARSW